MDRDGILERLAKGAVLKRDVEGMCRLGRRAVSGETLAAMVADELVRPLADGRFDITSTGFARVRRMRLRKMKGRDAGADAAEADDSFRAQHQLRATRLRSAREGQARVAVNLTESPLGWLRNRRDRNGRPYLTERHVEAGERLRTDFELAALPPKVTAIWGGQPVSRGKRAHREEPMTDRQLAARQRFHKAADAIPRDLKDAAVRVCCFHEGLESVEQRQGWPVRSGKLALRIALEQLANHYRLPPDEEKCSK